MSNERALYTPESNLRTFILSFHCSSNNGSQSSMTFANSTIRVEKLTRTVIRDQESLMKRVTNHQQAVFISATELDEE